MGADVSAIFRHKLSKKEILDLPQKVETWGDIKAFVEDSRNYLEQYEIYPLRKIKWEAAINEDLLETIWFYNEQRGVIHVPIYVGTNRLHTFFGILKFHRYTIEISLGAHHKYANLQSPVTARYMLELNRKIAQKFGETEILYCVDSGFKEQGVYDEVTAGVPLHEVIKFAMVNYGPLLKDLNEGMKKMFFLDDLRNDIGVLEEWNWSQVQS